MRRILSGKTRFLRSPYPPQVRGPKNIIHDAFGIMSDVVAQSPSDGKYYHARRHTANNEYFARSGLQMMGPTLAQH